MKNFLGSLLLLPAEQVLNHVLLQDGYIVQRLQPFVGKSLEVRSHKPDVVLSIVFLDNRIRLSSLGAEHHNLQATATISGAASDLLSLLLNPGQRPITMPGLTLSGDSLMVQDLSNALNDLDIDWQDYLGPLLGDVITNELGQLGKQAQQWSDSARSSMRRNVDDYLKEEIRAVPQRQEIEQFSDQLDQLRLDLDRAAARAAQLQARLDKSLKNQHLSD